MKPRAYLLLALLAILLVGCGGINPGPQPPDCPVCPPTPQPTPTPPAMTGPPCQPGVVNCNCIDQPPGQAPTCVVCDNSAPGGVSVIGTVPVCPPAPGPTPPTPTPTPPPGGSCSFPQGVPLIGPGPEVASIRPVVMATLKRLSGCNESTDCPLPNDNQQSWQGKVTADLRAQGLCAGQHEDGKTDQIAVATQCNVPWESYYVFACTPALPSDPPGTDTCPIVGRGKVRWAGQAHR